MPKSGAVDTDSFTIQREIAAALDVAEHFDLDTEWRRRLDFLAEELQRAGRKSLVLGISGGVDSLTAGRLCQLAVAELRKQGYDAHFVAMRLPYGEQRDVHDAEAAIAFIEPDEILRVDIQPAVDASLQSMIDAGASFGDAHAADFVAGNVRARQRMIVQYAAANALHGLVVGTDHAAEAVMGFFTKHGDGACDLAPLTGLTKRRVRALASHLGAPFDLVQKIPTADLELLRPLQPDEMALGLRYDAIDDFLEGRSVSRAEAERIVSAFRNTEHKRAGPRAPSSRRVSREG